MALHFSAETFPARSAFCFATLRHVTKLSASTISHLASNSMKGYNEKITLTARLLNKLCEIQKELEKFIAWSVVCTVFIANEFSPSFRGCVEKWSEIIARWRTRMTALTAMIWWCCVGKPPAGRQSYVLMSWWRSVYLAGDWMSFERGSRRISWVIYNIHLNPRNGLAWLDSFLCFFFFFLVFHPIGPFLSYINGPLLDALHVRVICRQIKLKHPVCVRHFDPPMNMMYFVSSRSRLRPYSRRFGHCECAERRESMLIPPR